MTNSTDKPTGKVAKDVDLGDSNVFPFLEYSINIASVNIENSLDFKYKLKNFASAIRHVLWHYAQVLEDFDVGGIVNSKKGVFLTSTDGRMLQIKTIGLAEIFKLHPKLPKKLSWIELFQVEQLVKQAFDSPK